jgi:hypothetical protein
MKTKLLTSVTLAIAVGACAQGTVSFNNFGTGYRAPIYFPEVGNSTLSKVGNTTAGMPPGTQVYTGGLLTGSGYTAQLFSGPAGTTDWRLLVAAASGGIVTFRSGAAAGFTSFSTATLANVAKDAPSAVFQIRVWDNSSGLYPTWAHAEPALFSDALSWGGWGNLFTVNAIGGDLNTPPSLVGQQSFNIYYVAAPEPSTYALLALGGFGLWLCRRRKLPDNNNHDLAPGKES